VGRCIESAFEPDARRLPLRRFPYFIVYRELQEYLEVVAFAHQSRRPGYWKTRGS